MNPSNLPEREAAANATAKKHGLRLSMSEHESSRLYHVAIENHAMYQPGTEDPGVMASIVELESFLNELE